MADGYTYESLLSSLESAGSISGDLLETSFTADTNRAIPLIDYGRFSKHTFFGDIRRKTERNFNKIITEYPIGLSGASVAALTESDILAVDKFYKEADGYTRWLLNELGKDVAFTGTEKSITANAVNNNQENVTLIHLHRDSDNSVTGDQLDNINAIYERIELYEDFNKEIEYLDAGTLSYFGVTGGEGNYANYSTRITEEVPASAEVDVIQNFKLENLIPRYLFLGDDTEFLKSFLTALSESFDEYKLYIENIPNLKKISYDSVDRVPDRFIPVLAKDYGVNLYETSADIDIKQELFNSSSAGYTSKEVTSKVWNRILNNIPHLLKSKGARESLEAICRIYGIKNNFLKINEHSIFRTKVKKIEQELVDFIALYSDGTNYVQTSVGATETSSLAFDFAAGQDFTIQTVVSATAAQSHTLVEHPLYNITLSDVGVLTFNSVTTPTVTVSTPEGSISSHIQALDNFTNITVSRSGDTLNAYLTTLSASPTGGNDIVEVVSGSYSDVSVGTESYDSTGGTVGGSTKFPSPNNFIGYMHEVRTWDIALEEEDIKEHTRNFQSISIENTKINNQSATYNNLKSHFKLREDIILGGDYNFIVNSAKSNYHAEPVGFGTTEKKYRHFSDRKRIVSSYPLGFSINNDKIRTSEENIEEEDVGYISFSMSPTNAVNREIYNSIQDFNVFDLLGDPSVLTKNSYFGTDINNKWNEISEQWNLSKNETFDPDPLNNALLKSGGSVLTVTGVSGSSVGLMNNNAFVKSMNNFNDTFGSIFPFSEQFIPAKTNVISKGLFIESPLLERHKTKRVFGRRWNSLAEVLAENEQYQLTADGNIISYDNDKQTNNAVPTVLSLNELEFVLNNHYLAGDLATTGSGSANEVNLSASAATTADFQGYQYYDNNIQETIDLEFSAITQVPNVSVNSTVNEPNFSQTRYGRFLPVRITPAAVDQTEVEITLDTMLISPTANNTASNGFISGRVKMLSGGVEFKTDLPALRFDFPTSADGTNLFIAEVGDIDAGEGRIVKDKDNSIVVSLESATIQLNLTLASVVRSLSAVAGDVTLQMVEDSASGSIGIVPINVTNLFNDVTYIFRVGINAVDTKDTDLIRQITQQGVEKITS